MNQLVGESIDSPKDRDRVFKLLAILKGQRVNIINNNDESYCPNNKGPVYGWAKCRPIQVGVIILKIPSLQYCLIFVIPVN